MRQSREANALYGAVPVRRKGPEGSSVSRVRGAARAVAAGRLSELIADD
eukprot:CAMPEP_0184378392 /NCGR_PEP_ID=MMETSP0007-20130409/3033_1 /TAXON_ID=97485 /ORGANISM="Prymnesium parvum, Strain Texoma1" /LENGTH=48 /DNA_ID= /DNA_START= /DNA_END= /DNA_ORIENTATION=